MKDPAWIKGKLIMKKVAIKDLAAQVGVTPRLVHYVIEGKRGGRRQATMCIELRRAIAQAVGCSYQTVWGVPDPEEKAV